MTNEAKHTPGPWEFKTAANGDNGFRAAGTGIFVEAFSEIRHAGENALEEALANARLIAAAPDLLAFVREIANRDPVFAKGHEKTVIANARVLVAKAVSAPSVPPHE